MTLDRYGSECTGSFLISASNVLEKMAHTTASRTVPRFAELTEPTRIRAAHYFKRLERPYTTKTAKRKMTAGGTGDS